MTIVIESISKPWVYTTEETGLRIAFNSIEGDPCKDDVLEPNGSGYKIIGRNKIECEM